MNIKNIILAVFMKVGDKVVVNVSDERRSYNKYEHANGTEGVIVRFKEYIDHRQRLSYPIEKTGTFLKRGMPIVFFADGTEESFDGHEIAWVDQSLNEIRREERAARGGYDTDDTVEILMRLGDLPTSLFWEGDEVWVVAGRHKGHGRPVRECATPAQLYVTNIEYPRSVDAAIVYSVEGTYASGHHTGQVRLNASDIILIKRGNLWKYHNGERDTITFFSIEEEIRFARMLHTVHEVRNPLRKDLYLWTRAEALTAIREGRADGFNVDAGMFGSGPSIRVQRFDDRDLGERVRAKTIEGWADTPEGEPDPENDARVEDQMKRYE